MNFQLPFWVMLFFIPVSLFAQQNEPSVDWKKFLPQSEVDQVVLFNTNGENDKKLNTRIYLSFLFRENHGDSLTKLLPQYYENKRVVTDPSIISEIVTAMPRDTCTHYPADRCSPQYRDIVLFYNKSKLVFTLKICLDCASTASMPFKAEAKCLANDLSTVYMDILGFNLFGERRW